MRQSGHSQKVCCSLAWWGCQSSVAQGWAHGVLCQKLAGLVPELAELAAFSLCFHGPQILVSLPLSEKVSVILNQNWPVQSHVTLVMCLNYLSPNIVLSEDLDICIKLSGVQKLVRTFCSHEWQAVCRVCRESSDVSKNVSKKILD